MTRRCRLLVGIAAAVAFSALFAPAKVCGADTGDPVVLLGNEAAFRAAYDTVLTTARWRPFSDNTLTLVDLDGIGQGERATILKLVLGNPDGRPDYLAIVGLSRGKATDVVVAESQSPLEPSDPQTLAQSMANRLDAGVTG